MTKLIEYTIPEDIQTYHPVTDEPVERVSGVEFIRAHILPDTRMRDTTEHLRYQTAIREAIRGKRSGQKFRVGLGEQELMFKVLEGPVYQMQAPGGGTSQQKGWLAGVDQLMPFIDWLRHGGTQVTVEPAEPAEPEAKPRPLKASQ